MAGVEERYRRRIAFVLVLVGLALILTGFALVVHHRGEVVAAEQPSPISASRENRINAMKWLLFWLVIFVIIFAASSFAFLRWSRHFRNTLLRPPRPPSPSEDVWAMHRLPEDLEPGEDLPRGGEEPDEPSADGAGPVSPEDDPETGGGRSGS